MFLAWGKRRSLGLVFWRCDAASAIAPVSRATCIRSWPFGCVGVIRCSSLVHAYESPVLGSDPTESLALLFGKVPLAKKKKKKYLSVLPPLKKKKKKKKKKK